MAYVNSTRLSEIGFPDRIAHAFDALTAKYKQYRLYRQTFDELSSLNDRELSDLGIGRADIRAVAKQAARNDAS